MPDTGVIINPYGAGIGDGSNPSFSQGRGGEVLVAMTHGGSFHAAMRGALFSFNVTAQTLPQVASGLVSVCSLYNPVGSNRNLELVDIDIGAVISATVVNVYGLYTSTPQLTAKGTFTTAGTPLPGLLNGAAAGVGVPYSAFTHSGTPTRWMIVGYNGAITTLTNQIMHYEFKGKAVLPPGNLVSVAASTAAATGSSVDISLSWIETSF